MSETGSILTALGGIGVFLLGMVLMTEGLQGLAGQSLRRILRRFTSTALRGVAAGTFVTALLQSSSATTVTVIGFVSAGLVSFGQGLGIVFGANIGTTFTGWIVAVLGFSVNLETVAFPVVLLGGLMLLFGNTRLALAGRALAGFALLFIGIGLMQAGMAGLDSLIQPSDLPGNTLLGRAELVLLGAAVTAVTQSSSAGVAAALVALDAGTIGFGQAALIVVGMNIGTTVTALLATLGGSVAARQTGVAHLLFNLITGLVAFVLLDLFGGWADRWITSDGPGAARYALVIFHTMFNVVGVVIMLLALDPFVALVRRLVPERREVLVAALDRALLRQPGAAVDAACAATEAIARHMYALLAARLSPGPAPSGDGRRLRDGLHALDEARAYMEQINANSLRGAVLARYLDILHTLDHLSRLGFRITQGERAAAALTEHHLRRMARILRQGLVRSLSEPALGHHAQWYGHLQEILRRHQLRLREAILAGTVLRGAPPERATLLLDAARWLHRVSYHCWRIELHLERIARSRDEAVERVAREEALEDVRAD